MAGSTTIIICETCSWPDGEKAKDGIVGGEAFCAHVEEAAQHAGVETRRHACLMNCQQSCSAAVAASGKISYVLGRFEPTAEAAHALVEYAVGHRESDTGAVPFRQWPVGVKGKFISRLPSLDD